MSIIEWPGLGNFVFSWLFIRNSSFFHQNQALVLVQKFTVDSVVSLTEVKKFL